jgi:hypothetical protein
MYTQILDLIVDDEEEQLESKCTHPSENMQLSFNQRLESILAESLSVQGELIRKIIFYYNSTDLQMYREYLLDIIRCEQIPFYLRVECLNEMESDDDVLMMLLRSSETDMPVSLLVMYAGRMLEGEYKSEVIKLMKRRVLDNDEVRDLYKVNTIHSTRKTRSVLIRLSIYYINRHCASLYSKLQVCGNTMSVATCGVLEEFALRIMTDDTIAGNSRGHAMDILIRFGSPTAKKKAEAYVATLGNLYIGDDAQSAHRQSISESVIKLYNDLTSRIVDVSRVPTFREARTILLSEYVSKLEDALDYIEGDHIVFGGINRNLKSCLCLVIGFIRCFGGDRTEMLYERLIEELLESVGTCSTGYLSRIANSLSGVDGYIVGITWAEQIRDNLRGRLNARIRDDENSGDILVQMTNSKLEDRREFFRFLRENISDIKEEMYQEFRNYMSDSDWDQFIFKAITEYYGVG